ncbi:MAG: transposase, partial [Nitrospinae bacterium]|nr:transposase [Nitrospinota bacterium]
FLKILLKTIERFNWIIHAYCLMDNHYHLLVETPDANLSQGMRQLNGMYTQSFNRAHNRVGHVFQGRYKSVLIQKESHLLEAARYIALNPVRARAVEAPEHWPWSSYLGTAGLRKPHPCLKADWILSQFGRQKRLAQKKYRTFVRAGMGAEPLWKKARGMVALGDEGYLKRIAAYLDKVEPVIEITRAQRYAARPDLNALFSGAANRAKRNRNIALAVRAHGYSQQDVARYLKLHYGVERKIL